MADPSMPPLPAAFLRFLEQNQIDAAVYSAAHALPRYVRLKEQAVLELVEIEEELGVKLTRVAWLPGFFSLPPDAQIAGSCAYQQGKLYGIDAASGAAVAALEVSHCDHVLDLCAAPGAKLCMVAELLGASGSLTAVDIAQPRLAACRTMLQKYGLGSRIRLYLGDGTTFSLLPLKETTKLPDFHLGAEGEISTDSRLEVLKYYGEWRSGKSRKQKRATKLAKHLGIPVQRGDEPELFFYGKESGVVGMKVVDLPQSKCMHSEATLQDGYDKVLVDAECTHDGSLKHIIKYEQWGWDTFERRFLDADRVASITLLQLQLLTNGFRLLKPGGTLVYSTCSFTKTQNEGVVERFLTNQANAELQEVDPAKHWPCRPGDLPHTLRFDPVTSNTSGLFIAKIVKRVT
ncbi:unnamed protein product [Sphagnum compactum]